MSHIFFIDPLDKLNIKKDSSLMMALSFKAVDEEVYILFEEDFAINNQGINHLLLYPISGHFKEDGFYLSDVELGNPIDYEIGPTDTIHMRIDPPYDSRYQRYLWMLDFLEYKTKCRVLNNPLGIMKHNEKLAAYKRPMSLTSFIGSSEKRFLEFVANLKKEGIKDLILKPLDLYSGIGVEKVSINASDLKTIFAKKVDAFKGAIIAQPFQEAVFKGEIRSLFMFGEEVGSILKKPNQGEFLANIAQGAQFEEYSLSEELMKECKEIANQLLIDGVTFIAFDILADAVTEINVTCPGLLVEVSYAKKTNLAHTYVKLFNKYYN